MDFTELARNRYSVRKFLDKPVEQELLEQILEAGNLAPTAANNQPQRIYVLRSDEARETARSCSKCTYGAPVILLIAYDRTEDWNNPKEAGIHSGEQDVSIVATHMMLKAAELGLGTCWVNLFSPSDTGKAFGLPDQEHVVLMMPLGYADPSGGPVVKWHNQKKEPEETVRYL